MPSSKKLLIGILLLVFKLSLPLSAFADESFSLKPFTATYELDWKGGVAFNGSSVRKLFINPEGDWTFKSEASAFFASVFESSQFNWHDQKIIPSNYNFKRSVLGKKRLATVHFDWDELKVMDSKENKPWKISITEGVQDKLSYQLVLQQELANGANEFNYRVADGGELKQYKFKVDGRETIQAPIGTFETIRVKRIRESNKTRETYIWFAPELNFQIIKLHQIEKQDKSYTLLLKDLKS